MDNRIQEDILRGVEILKVISRIEESIQSFNVSQEQANRIKELLAQIESIINE